MLLNQAFSLGRRPKKLNLKTQAPEKTEGKRLKYSLKTELFANFEFPLELKYVIFLLNLDSKQVCG